MRQTYACVFWIKTRHLSISGEKELPQGNPSFNEKKKKKRSKTWIWSVGLSTQFLVKWLVKKREY